MVPFENGFAEAALSTAELYRIGSSSTSAMSRRRSPNAETGSIYAAYSSRNERCARPVMPCVVIHGQALT